MEPISYFNALLADPHIKMVQIWKLRGEALAQLHEVIDAETMLRTARTAAQAQGLRSLLWRIDVALGKLYGTQARHEEADQAFSTARLLIEELATNVSDEHIREQFLCATLPGRSMGESTSPP